MKTVNAILPVALLGLLVGNTATLAQPAEADTSMSFFITSSNMGEGANLGGLTGADAHCRSLAEAAGVTGKSWAAYLSTSSEHARDRIGSGPWYNVNGVLMANNLDELHYSNVNLTKANSLTEKGAVVNGRGDDPNEHDVLTGSNPDGTFSGMSCNDWTSNAADGSATVGHFDRTGGGPMPTSWNSSHPSRGCGTENLRASGGNGYFYCFAK